MFIVDHVSNRKNYSTIILLFISLFFLFTVINEEFNMISSLAREKNKSLTGFDDCAINFVVDHQGKVDFSFLSKQPEGCVVLQELSPSEYIYALADYNGFLNYTKNIDSTIKNKNMYVCNKKAMQVHDTEPFMFNKKRYEQLSLFDDSTYLTLEYGIFIWNPDIFECNFDNNRFVVVARDSVTAKALYKVIYDNLSKLGIETKSIKLSSSSMDDTSKTSSYIIVVVFVTLASALGGIVLLDVLWIRRFSQIREAYYIVGRAFGIVEIGSQYFATAALSLLLAIVVELVLGQKINLLTILGTVLSLSIILAVTYAVSGENYVRVNN
ncbi:MAG: hypothetical protein MJ123_05870 [Lachnospiraceae bacterium]|nr:hypothetical protein [Lachnospiraceae bacterium]